MTPGFPAPSARVLQALDARLLVELRRQRLPLPAAQGACAGRGDGAIDRVALYRQAIEQLEAKVARGQGHPPMRQQEVVLLCRCMLSCRTLREAIACAVEFCAMLEPRAGRLSLQVVEGQAIFHMDSLRRQHSSAACLVDVMGLFCYLQLWSWLIGRPLQPRQVFAAHPQREDAAPLLGLFAVPVVMGQRTYGFVFDAALLAQAVVRRPVELAAFVKDFPFRLAAQSLPPSSWAGQVRQQLDAALEHVLPLPSLQAVAKGLQVPPSTLRRHLAREGTGYQLLRQQALCAAAQRSLCEGRAPLGDVASQLGFGSVPAFRRAFVQWTGMSPSQFRSQAAQGQAPPERIRPMLVG